MIQITNDPNKRISNKANELMKSIEQKEKSLSFAKKILDNYNQKLQNWSDTFNSINSKDFSNKFKIVQNTFKDPNKNPFNNQEQYLEGFSSNYIDIKQNIDQLNSQIYEKTSNNQSVPVNNNIDSLISKEDKLFLKANIIKKNVDYIYEEIQKKHLAEEKLQHERQEKITSKYSKCNDSDYILKKSLVIKPSALEGNNEWLYVNTDIEAILTKTIPGKENAIYMKWPNNIKRQQDYHYVRVKNNGKNPVFCTGVEGIVNPQLGIVKPGETRYFSLDTFYDGAKDEPITSWKMDIMIARSDIYSFKSDKDARTPCFIIQNQ